MDPRMLREDGRTTKNVSCMGGKNVDWELQLVHGQRDVLAVQGKTVNGALILCSLQCCITHDALP